MTPVDGPHPPRVGPIESRRQSVTTGSLRTRASGAESVKQIS